MSTSVASLSGNFHEWHLASGEMQVRTTTAFALTSSSLSSRRIASSHCRDPPHPRVDYRYRLDFPAGAPCLPMVFARASGHVEADGSAQPVARQRTRCAILLFLPNPLFTPWTHLSESYRGIDCLISSLARHPDAYVFTFAKAENRTDDGHRTETSSVRRQGGRAQESTAIQLDILVHQAGETHRLGKIVD